MFEQWFRNDALAKENARLREKLREIERKELLKNLLGPFQKEIASRGLGG